MADSKEVPVDVHYPERSGFHIRVKRNDQEHWLKFQNYHVYGRGKPCDHNQAWFDNLFIRGNRIFGVYTHEPGNEYLSGSGQTVYKKLVDTMPMQNICTDNMKVSVPMPSKVGMLCTGTECPYVFGILWPNLHSALGLQNKAKTNLVKMLGLRNRQCILPKIMLPNGNLVECVPIDMVPFVLGLFTRALSSRYRIMVDKIMWILYHNVVANPDDSGIHRINVARIASLTRTMDWYRRMQSTAFNEVLDKIDRTEIQMTRVAKERERENMEKTRMQDDLRRLKHTVKKLNTQNMTMMEILEKQDRVLAVLGGHVDPQVIRPLRGVNPETASRFYQRMPADDFLVRLRAMCDKIVQDNPRASLIEAIYMDELANELGNGKPDPTWYTVFQQVCSICVGEDPRKQDIEDAFSRWLRKRKMFTSQHLSRKRHKSLNVGY